MKRRLAIQHVHLDWDKSGRGAEQGAIRNALPRDYPFRAPFDSEEGWLHRIALRGDDGYRAIETLVELDKVEAWQMPIKTRIDGDHLWIKLAIRTRWPERPHLDGWIARLPFGQRLTIRLNTKYDGHDQRRYDEDTIHIGWADTATLDLPLFREIDERVILY